MDDKLFNLDGLQLYVNISMIIGEIQTLFIPIKKEIVSPDIQFSEI